MFAITSPESAGVRSEGILRFFDDMEEKRLHMHAVMILRHGQVIAEASYAPWSKDKLHMLFSLSKSFRDRLRRGIGLCAGEGKEQGGGQDQKQGNAQRFHHNRRDLDNGNAVRQSRRKAFPFLSP